MGKHRHKKSFYDVDEDELHHNRRRRLHSNDKQDETKQCVPSISSFNNSKIDDDEAALQSPPPKRKRSSSSKILSQLIEDPEFLANAGPKAIEFAETARQLLAKPDLDATTQQIICAMAQAAVNVGKRLNCSSSTPTDQCVDEFNVNNSTNYSSSTSHSPTSSNTSSSSTSTTPQLIQLREENKNLNQTESDENILIKQMIERAMKLTQQGDTRHAQHLLGIIHEKLTNKRKRAASEISLNYNNDNEKHKISSSDDFHSLSSMLNEDSLNNKLISPSETEPLNDFQNSSCFSYPPPPPLPPPPPPPPLPETNSLTSPPIPVPPIKQVQELLSNPSEVQDILKKLFGSNENCKVSPPEEYQIQSHLTSPNSYQCQTISPYNNNNTTSIYSNSSRLNSTNQSLRLSQTSTINSSQPYNSSLAFIQGNRRNLPPLQTPDRCFSSSSTKTTKQHQSHRSSSYSSNAPPLMKVHPTFPFGSSTPPLLDINLTSWPNNNEQQRNFHPFWCATCSLGFPHQIAYQEHLRNHIPCNVPGCSYAATEQLVRIHHQNIHENNLRNRNLIRPTHYQQQQILETPWPLTRM